MPLSRLTPRSSSTGVARQKKHNQEQNNSQRHLHLWAAIRKTREELDQWNRQAEHVDALFTQHIAPRENQLTQVVLEVTERLITQFSHGILDIPDQSLLGLWITDNLNSLQDHPFADQTQTTILNRQWLALLNNDGPVENQLARLARENNTHYFSQDGQSDKVEQSVDKTATDSEQFDDDQDTPQGDMDVEGNEKTRSDNAPSGSPGGSHHNEESAAQPIEEKIKTLEEKLSVERLFRQLAKVLHPDREPDEKVKAAKHVLMSQCLQARKDKDIHALLTLYCEHVGELPEDLNNNSHSELISALEVQLKQLQLELRDKRFGDPLHTMIVERYASSTLADSERRIKNHATSLDDEISAAQRLTRQLNGHDGLLDALDERRAVEQDRMAINEMTGM